MKPDKVLNISSEKIAPDSVEWRCPSNIAITKYWGKKEYQLPLNPSISFTLNKCYTETRLEYKPRRTAQKGLSVNFSFEGVNNDIFQRRIENYLEKLREYYPFLNGLEISIYSKNSFPHSAGIASSASAFGALALCVASMEHNIFKSLSNDADFDQKASFLARLGSGSACRSIFGEASIWGTMEKVDGTSDYYAVPIENLHPVFKDFQNSILIVNSKAKEISSSAGHQLMNTHLFLKERLKVVEKRNRRLMEALINGDISSFGNILEEEALMLHALMMTGRRPYILMASDTIACIKKIWKFREKTELPVYFTLDAGPNIHLLYPKNISEEVEQFLSLNLNKFWDKVIADEVGQGPVEL